MKVKLEGTNLVLKSESSEELAILDNLDLKLRELNLVTTMFCTDLTVDTHEFYISLSNKNYNELIYAVGNKYPNETRHETALRYIKQAEESIPCAETDTHERIQTN